MRCPYGKEGYNGDSNWCSGDCRWTNNECVPDEPAETTIRSTSSGGNLELANAFDSLQPADIGWPTGNGKKLSKSQGCCLAQLCQAVA